MRKFLGGIAVAALCITAVHADPGGGKGHGGGQEERGNGNGGGHGPGGGEDRGPEPMTMGGPAREHGNGNGHRDGPEFDTREARGNDRADMPVRAAERGSDQMERGGEDRFERDRAQAPFVRDDREHDGQGRLAEQDRGDLHRPDWRSFDQHGLINGCPPGLAKKNNGCMPPGLARQAPAYSYPSSWWGLRGLNDVSGYRYYNGDLVRLSPAGAIAGYYPLLGGSLAIGNPWPSAWQPTPLDPYYANYYGLGGNYRYFDGAIYQVDPTTSAIQAVAALLTGDTFNVGQRMPPGYDVYNVPYEYRSRYVDGPDAYYRYSDGYIYQVDPKTQLIAAAIQLLAGR